ncbi:MAG: hypothetical protein VKP57_10440 [Candidatus Sericytochromatia bacterium]|jgi:hypothetical protein|nr:hypothetical protein [Candidatus Sericytochromatia bacterium]
MAVASRAPRVRPSLEDVQWIAGFRATRLLLAAARPDDAFVEIRQLLAKVPAVVRAFGWSCRPAEVEEAFGRLFHRLDWEARKGRDARKFVHLADRYGQSEPFVLIKLQENP